MHYIHLTASVLALLALTSAQPVDVPTAVADAPATANVDSTRAQHAVRSFESGQTSRSLTKRDLTGTSTRNEASVALDGAWHDLDRLRSVAHGYSTVRVNNLLKTYKELISEVSSSSNLPIAAINDLLEDVRELDNEIGNP